MWHQHGEDVQDHGNGCWVVQQQGVRKPGSISPYLKHWYNRGVQGSVFVDLAWYCPGFHPRGSLDFGDFGYVVVVMEFEDIPGEPSWEIPLDSVDWALYK